MLDKKLEALNAHGDTIKCIYYNKITTISDVVATTGKSVPYVMKVLNELKQEGYIAERGLASSRGGRKPLSYSLVGNAGYILAVALDQFGSQMVFVDMNSQFVGNVQRHELEINKLSVREFFNVINHFITQSLIPTEMIIGIGLTMPGFVDTEKGQNYTYAQFCDPSIVHFLEEQLQLPVFIENDSTAIALAEQKFGVAAGDKNTMVINLGWGIGLGMILNDQIFRGNNGLAGEFSHIPLFKNGKLCQCGKHGCLETEASLIAVANTAKEAITQGTVTSLVNYPAINADAIINEARKGDVFSVQVISEAAYHVGEGLAILIHLMNPKTILLSGKGAVIGRLWLAPIQQAINEHSIPHLTQFTDIKISDLNDRAQLIGTAALVIENLGKPLEKKMEKLQLTFS